MKYIRKIIIVIWAFIMMNIEVSSQDKTNIQHSTVKFPVEWLGLWEGELEIYNEKGLVQKIPMKAEHMPTDTTGIYIWSLIYGEDSIAGRRDYFLKTIDSEKGHYLIDERNGIFLDSYVMADKLICNFEVGGNYLTSTYSLFNDKLIFEIFVFDSKVNRVSGDLQYNGENIPKVSSFKVKAYQKAILSKK